MSNPFNPTTDKRKYDFYEKGYKCGLRGWVYRQRTITNHTSWSQGYYDAVARKKMNQLILGDKYYEHVHGKLSVPFYKGT